MSPISPSTRMPGLIAFTSSSASFVRRTFSSNGNADESKEIISNPAFAASTASPIECVLGRLGRRYDLGAATHRGLGSSRALFKYVASLQTTLTNVIRCVDVGGVLV